MLVQEVLASASRIIAAEGEVPLEEGFLASYLQTLTNSISWLCASLDKLAAPAVDPDALAPLQVRLQHILSHAGEGW